MHSRSILVASLAFLTLSSGNANAQRAKRKKPPATAPAPSPNEPPADEPAPPPAQAEEAAQPAANSRASADPPAPDGQAVDPSSNPYAGGAPGAEGEPPMPQAEPPPQEEPRTRVNVIGYLIPGFAYAYRPQAVPRDRTSYAYTALGGLRFTGSPIENWAYGFEFAVAAAGSSVSLPVEEVSVSFVPADWYTLTFGHLRMPFSVGQNTTVTAQMFPSRPAPTEVFLSGADEGILNSFVFLKGRIFARAGIFNGSSLGLQIPNTTSLGPVFSFFIDTQPLGSMPPTEGDQGRGPFRFGIGLGALYRPGILYDATGYDSTHFKDLRVSAALRASIGGFFLQGEVLRRVATDDLSGRPATATGAYVQSSFYFPVKLGKETKIGLSPVARAGVSLVSQEFAPQEIRSFEAGLAWYPRGDLEDPRAIRLLLQYAGEQRFPSDEVAHRAVANFMYRW